MRAGTAKLNRKAAQMSFEDEIVLSGTKWPLVTRDEAIMEIYGGLAIKGLVNMRLTETLAASYDISEKGRRMLAIAAARR